MAAKQRDLPADLINEILSRLPVKSLLRFRSVAKPWLALVDRDANFARMHLNTFKNNRHETRLLVENKIFQHHVDYEVLCSETFEPIPETLPPQKKNPICSSHRTINSVNGLILLNYRHAQTGQPNSLKLWNPSIRKFLEIPPLLEPELCLYRFRSINIGLGYDPVANTNKIVKLIFIEETRTLDSIAIYTLGDGSWEFTKRQGDWQLSMWVSEAVYFQSSLYFIAHNKCWDKDKDLVWFNLSRETFSSIKMHGGKECVDNDWKLVPINGGSALEVYNWNCSSICVWLLDSESMCWTKTQVYYLENVDLLHVKKNGDMMLRRFDKGSLVLQKWLDEVTFYCRKTKEHKTVKQEEFDEYMAYRSCYVQSYVESLIMHTLF